MEKTVFLALLLMLLTCVPAAAFNAVVEPELTGAQVLVADLLGLGTDQLLFGRENGVFVLEDDGIKELIQLSGKVSALAVGDLSGDFRPDLAVGTAGVGALYLFSERGGKWERHGHAQYLWDTISRLGIFDFNQDGWGDVVALTERGEAFVYLSQEGNLFPLWKSPTGEQVVGWEVLDVDNNGFPDLVYALRSGYVAVLSWDGEKFGTLWENYPWGAVESLVVVPNPSSPEWLVVTSQKMLYSWRWRNGEVVVSRQFEARSLGEHLFFIPQEGLLSLSEAKGIALFTLQSSAVEEKWRVPGLFGDWAFYYRGEFYFRDLNGTYLKLVEGEQQWRLFLNDREITAFVELEEREGQLYFDLLDLAPLLGITLDSSSGWHAFTSAGEMIFRPDQRVVEWQGLFIPLVNPILVEDGVPFVPWEVISLLGWKAQVDTLRQQVTLMENWGWWL